MAEGITDSVSSEKLKEEIRKSEAPENLVNEKEGSTKASSIHIHSQNDVQEVLSEPLRDTLEEEGVQVNHSSIKEEERSILTEFSSVTLEEHTKKPAILSTTGSNNDITDNLSPPYNVLESSEQTSPSSSVVTDSSPNEPPEENEDFLTGSPLMNKQQRAGAAATLSNVEATGMLGRMSSREEYTGGQGSLPFYQGTVIREGEMVSFVADDLMTKIRQSASSASTSPANSHRDISPTTASMSSSSSRFSMRSSSIGSSSAIPPIDPMAVPDLEKQCKRVADSLDLMFGHLAGTLHNMSAITVGHTQTYRDAVEKAGITVDQCVRSMYALMAKCEELQKTMQTTRELANQIKSIKRQLDELEALCK